MDDGTASGHSAHRAEHDGGEGDDHQGEDAENPIFAFGLAHTDVIQNERQAEREYRDRDQLKEATPRVLRIGDARDLYSALAGFYF